MRSLLLIFAIICGYNFVYGQEEEFQKFAVSALSEYEIEKKKDLLSKEFNNSPNFFSGEREPDEQFDFPRFRIIPPASTSEKHNEIEKEQFLFIKSEAPKLEKKPVYKKINKVNFEKQSNGSTKFHWKPALTESLYFLGIQHGFRMIQKKTRRELKGRFLPEWGRSVKNLGGWRDGDSSFTNYVAHPMQGVVTGRIFINNSEKSRRSEFGRKKEYWESRFKAMIWSGIWSAQFELGPISEASIGNVGLYDKISVNRMGWVDIVITPTAGTGVLIGEDLIDKYILKKWLEKGSSRTRMKIFRTFLTPFQSFTNVLGGKVPWKRYNRK
jgi:hypothetical protein